MRAWGQAAAGTEPALDPASILNDLSITRELTKKSLPVHPGTWQKLIDQPYFKSVPELKADRLLFHGQCEDAEILCNDLLKRTDWPADKRAGLVETRLEAILQQGGEGNIRRFEGQVAKLDPAQQVSPRVVKLRAQAMLQTGRLTDALALLKTFADAHKTLTADANTFAALNIYGQALELKARYNDAIATYDAVADFAGKDLPEDPALRTEVAKAALRKGILSDTKGEGTSKQSRQSAQAAFNAILALDSTYWPAQLESTRLLFQTHNLKDGMAGVNLVLDMNPYNVDARLMALDTYIDQYEFEKATALIAELRAIDDRPIVEAYAGRLLLKQRQPDDVVAPLQRAIARDPALLEARGWLAAVYTMRNQPAKAEDQLNAVLTSDRTPHPMALFEDGEVLRDARQYPEAEKVYKQATDEAAWWSDPLIGLAQLYLDQGNLDQAQVVFDRGYKLDAYGIKTINELRLLQMLSRRDTLETAHFIIRYQGPARPDPLHPDAAPPDQPSDRVLAELAAVWCEKIYPDVTGDFQYQPPVKTTIELYPSHAEFGVRITGMSQIGTVGASTGNVIAIDAPRTGRDLMGNFDWARVIRHEFTHTVTLGLTHNRIPHWLTEGAAVHEEQAPRDWEACQLLDSNFRSGTLFKLNELTFGFIRPKKPTDRQLAYAESEWVYGYLIDTYGQDKMIAFLHAFRDGMSEPDAYKAAFGKGMETINAEFLTWAGQQLKAWGLPNNPLPKLADAKAAAAKAPTDVDAQKTLVQTLLAANQLADAEKAVRAMLKLDPENPDAREYLASILVATKKTDDAKPILEKLATDAPDRPVVARLLGQIAMDAKDYNTAATWFEKLEQIRPQDESPYRGLAMIYLTNKDTKNAIIQLEKLAAHEQKDERIPRRIAELMLDDKQFNDAQEYAYRAIRINPYNAVNHQLMAKALLGAGQAKDAIGYFSMATELEPQTAEFWADLADACGASGDKDAAAAAARKAVAIEPKSAAKKWIP